MAAPYAHPSATGEPALTAGESTLPTTSEQLEQDFIIAQRLAALGTLTAIVAHEFNNLLTPLFARAEFALQTGEPADMRKALERTRAQAQRAMEVTQGLIALAKREEWAIERYQVAAGVKEAVAALVRPLEKDGVELHVAVADDLFVAAQPNLFVQVLLNLLLNARAAMRETRGRLTVNAAREGENVVIDVCDSGGGLPPEQIDAVINPFLAGGAEAGADWPGAGLGLKACRLIAGRHGASLRALANEGRGCTFRVVWPAHSELRIKK